MPCSPLDNVSERLSVWPSKGLRMKKLGLLGKEGGRGLSFVQTNGKRNTLIG